MADENTQATEAQTLKLYDVFQSITVGRVKYPASTQVELTDQQAERPLRARYIRLAKGPAPAAKAKGSKGAK